MSESCHLLFLEIRPEIPNLFLTMRPFSISTDEHVPLKFLMTKYLSKITKIHWSFSQWRLVCRHCGQGWP